MTLPNSSRDVANMPPKAVFFDFDGVIADTENYHVAAWQRTLAAFGWELADEVAKRSVEIDDRVFLIEVFSEHDFPRSDIVGWVQRKQDLTIQMLKDRPRLYPGVHDLVRALQRRARLAVVSTTWCQNIEAVLNATGLADAFEFIIGKEMVYDLKPAPEAYREALETMGIRPSEAVALEDSGTGVTAAMGAGVRVIGVGHRLPRGDWVEGAEFLTDLADTAGVLATLGFPPVA